MGAQEEQREPTIEELDEALDRLKERSGWLTNERRNAAMEDIDQAAKQLLGGANASLRAVPDGDAERLHQEWLADTEEWRAEQEAKHRKQLLEKSGLPKRFERYRLDSFKQRSKLHGQALRAATRYVEDFDPKGIGFAFRGPVGTGKTHLLVAVMRELIEQGRACLFVKTVDLMDHLRRFNPEDPAEGAEAWLGRVKEAPVLFLDDLGAEKPTEWVSERLFSVIDHRYAEELPTCLTTNLMPQDLADRLGARLVSRLVEMCEWVALEGPDQRMAARERKEA